MRPKMYIDGANIAHEDSKTILASRIEIAFEEMKKLGFEPHVLLPVQKMLKLIRENRSETALATLGSQLKNNNGFGINGIFGNSKHAARFLKSQGFSVRQDDKNVYVEGVPE